MQVDIPVLSDQDHLERNVQCPHVFHDGRTAVELVLE